MEEILKMAAKSILVQQSTNIGLKVVNEKRIVKSDWQKLGLAFVLFALLNSSNNTNPKLSKNL